MELSDEQIQEIAKALERCNEAEIKHIIEALTELNDLIIGLGGLKPKLENSDLNKFMTAQNNIDPSQRIIQMINKILGKNTHTNERNQKEIRTRSINKIFKSLGL